MYICFVYEDVHYRIMSKALGRPTKYSLELCESICERLSTTKRGLEDICTDADMPGKSTVWRWIGKYPDFWEMYARARKFQTEIMFDEMRQIACSPLIDEYGEPLSAGMAMAVVQQRKLIIDTIKFMLSKLQPDRFGDNRNMNVDVKVNHSVSKEQFQKLLDAAIAPIQIEDAEIEEI